MDDMKNADVTGDLLNSPLLNPSHDPDPDMTGDTLREECGVFGIYGHPDAAAIYRARSSRPSASRSGSRRHRQL